MADSFSPTSWIHEGFEGEGGRTSADGDGETVVLRGVARPTENQEEVRLVLEIIDGILKCPWMGFPE